MVKDLIEQSLLFLQYHYRGHHTNKTEKVVDFILMSSGGIDSFSEIYIAQRGSVLSDERQL